MPANTYVALATQTLGSAAASVTFSSIPQGYTDLVLVYSAKVSTAADLGIYFNGVTGTSYSTTYLAGNGSAAASARSSNAGFIFLDYYGYPDATNFNVAVYNIMNYSNTTTFKTVLGRSGNASTGTDAIVGLYRDTAAITSLTIDPVGAPTLSTGSTFSLYGVAAASVGAKATGGAIYQDATYFYHVFSGNGTFTPSQALSADVLVVAGGGGGTYGAYSGAGGGAGGLLQFTNQTLSATPYVCTIGGGGTAGQTSTNGGDSTFQTLASAIGGGGGGGTGTGPTGNNGKNGGSGGGGSTNSAGNQTFGGTGVAGPPRQGYDGGGNGNFGNSPYPSGAGGGAGAVGGTAPNSTTSGTGGIGATSAFINAIGAACSVAQLSNGNYYFAGGGGGCNGNATSGTPGGLGGGGTGGTSGNGTPNTGGGGGASGTTISGAGGSGVIIVRYAK